MVENPYVERARQLRGLILESRDATESARRLTPALCDALVDADLLRLLVPRDAGGLEVEPLVAYRVYEELARADASVAWVSWNNGLPAILSRALAASARREIFGDPRGVYANSTRPSGIATPDGSRFRIKGQWSLVSGCELATWIPVMARIEGGEEGDQVRMFFLPRGDYQILDTWYSGGLRGSGSHDIVVEDAVVPGERSCSPLAKSQIDGPLHRFPFAPLLAPGCASICLGIASSALEAVFEIVEGNPVTDSGPPLHERAVLHSVLAESEGEIEAARLFLHEVVGEIWNACQQGESSLEQRAALWRAVLHTATACKRVVGSLYEAGGASSLYTRSLLERCHRDIWTLSQHVILNPLWRGQAGRVRLGLPPTNPLF